MSSVVPHCESRYNYRSWKEGFDQNRQGRRLVRINMRPYHGSCMHPADARSHPSLPVVPQQSPPMTGKPNSSRRIQTSQILAALPFRLRPRFTTASSICAHLGFRHMDCGHEVSSLCTQHYNLRRSDSDGATPTWHTARSSSLTRHVRSILRLQGTSQRRYC
jgi:hypothetical protein